MNDMDNNYNIFRFKELYIRRINYLNIRLEYAGCVGHCMLIDNNSQEILKRNVLIFNYKNIVNGFFIEDITINKYFDIHYRKICYSIYFRFVNNLNYGFNYKGLDSNISYNAQLLKMTYDNKYNKLKNLYLDSLLKNKNELKDIFDNISSFFKQGILSIIYKNNFL